VGAMISTRRMGAAQVGQRALSKLDGRVVLVDSWLAAALSLQMRAGCGCLGRRLEIATSVGVAA